MSSKKPYQYNIHFHSSKVVTGSNPVFSLISSITEDKKTIIIKTEIIIMIIIKVIIDGQFEINLRRRFMQPGAVNSLVILSLRLFLLFLLLLLLLLLCYFFCFCWIY